MIDFSPVVNAAKRLRNAIRIEEAEPYYTKDTSLTDEMAIDLFKETKIPVITRDGSKWFRGVKVREGTKEDPIAAEHERMNKYLRDKYGEDELRK